MLPLCGVSIDTGTEWGFKNIFHAFNTSHRTVSQGKYGWCMYIEIKWLAGGEGLTMCQQQVTALWKLQFRIQSRKHLPGPLRHHLFFQKMSRDD